MYICTVCLDYAREKLQETRIITSNNNESNAKDDNNDDENNCIEDNNSININVEMNNDDSLLAKIQGLTAKIKCLKWRDLEDDIKFSLCELSKSLGELIKSDLDMEKGEMALECRSFEKLANVDPRKWYQERNEVMTSFLHGCTGVSIETTNEKKYNACLHAIEQILYTKNINLVTPFSFQRNILTYIISKSKMACNIVGGWENSGSYTKVNSLLDLPSEPLTIQGTSDITITFDNEQKVGRHSGSIREGSKQPMSIITTVAIIKSNPETRCQFSEFNRQDVDN